MENLKIIATNSGKSFTLTPAGNFVARCYSMIHLGTITEEFQGEKKDMNKVRLTWELPSELHVFNEEKGEQPFSISKEFTLSLHEKAKLRQYLESWRGKGFTDDEAKQFDIVKLIGVPCMLNIIHKTSKNGNKYADISSISCLPKGIDCPEQINKSVIFSVSQPNLEVFETFPDFIKDKIKSSAEWKAMQTNEVDTPNEVGDDETDDLPF